MAINHRMLRCFGLMPSKSRTKNIQKAEKRNRKQGYMVVGLLNGSFACDRYVAHVDNSEDPEHMIPWTVVKNESEAHIFRSRWMAKSMCDFWNVMRPNLPDDIYMFTLRDMARHWRMVKNTNIIAQVDALG